MRNFEVVDATTTFLNKIDKIFTQKNGRQAHAWHEILMRMPISYDFFVIFKVNANRDIKLTT